MKKQSMESEGMFADQMSDKGLIFQICGELLYLNSRKLIAWSKNELGTWMDISPNKMCKWLTGIWKDIPPYIIRDMDIKTRYHCTSIRKVKIQNTDNNYCWQKMKQQEFSFTTSRDTKWYSHFGKGFGGFLQNWTHSYHIIQQSYSSIFIQMRWKLMSTERPAHRCL